MRIIIVDDHNLFLQGIKSLLASHLPAATLEAYQHVQEAFAALEANPVADLVLADIFMPKFNGLTMVELLAQNKIFVPVLLISSAEDVQLIRQYLNLGASGFVHKSSQPEELLNAIRQVLSQGTYLHPEVAEKIHSVNRRESYMLSKRQAEVLASLAEGLSNKEIGSLLGISELTVKSHVSALFDVFSAQSRLECVRKAEKLGLVAKP